MALRERLASVLRRVQKPGRYTGGEWNSIVKDWTTAEVSLALCHPDLYEIGMANLGIHLLYSVVNSNPRFVCERVFTPWRDMAQELRKEGLSLYSLETKRPVADFDILGFSLSHELCYTNVLETLDLAGIPLLAQDRDSSSPLVIAGGPCVSNPEPLAAFVDLYILGEGEEVLPELLELYGQIKRDAGGERPPKAKFLAQAVEIPGVYVPSFYDVTYHPNGTVASIVPICQRVPERVRKRFLAKLAPPLTNPVVPYLELLQDRGTIEVQRSCPRRYACCSPGSACRSRRERPSEEIISAIDQLVRQCGYQEIALLPTGFGDYGPPEEVLRAIHAKYPAEELTLTFPTPAAEPRWLAVAETLKEGKKRGYAFTLEAGSQRLRELLGQPLLDEALLSTAETAFRLGWTRVKYQLALGYPGESQEDVQAMVELVAKTQKVSQQALGWKARVRVEASIFTPKPHTPFQRAPQEALEGLLTKLGLLKQGLKKVGASFTPIQPEPSIIEAVLSLGDRRVGAAVAHAWQLGCTFDASVERFDFGSWLQAFEKAGLDPGFYANRARDPDEMLPWSHIEVGLPLLGTPEPPTPSAKRACKSQPCPICSSQRKGLASTPAQAPQRS